MLLEGVLIDVEAELAVEVLKETPAHIVTLIDDDGILLAELVEICKGRTKHRVGRDKTSSCALIVVMKSCLYGCDVRENTLLWEIWYYLVEGRDGIFYRHCIDAQLWLEGAYLLKVCKTLTVICKTQTLRIILKNSHFMVEAEEVDEKRPHLACS